MPNQYTKARRVTAIAARAPTQMQRSVGNASTTPAPAPASEVERECNRLDAAATELSQCLQTFTARLSPVLVPTPKDDTGAGVGPECSSTVGRHVNASTNSIYQSIAGMRSLMDNLAI